MLDLSDCTILLLCQSVISRYGLIDAGELSVSVCLDMLGGKHARLSIEAI